MTTPATKQLSLPGPERHESNIRVAAALDEIATLLEAQLADPFRIRAYRNGAATIRNLEQPVDRLYQHEGLPGLEELPGIGRSLSRAIAQHLTVGHIPLLDQLRGDDSPERRFSSVPGIGPELAERIHNTLHIETLGELLSASFSGQLENVPGIGPLRSRAIRDSLQARRATFEQSHSTGSSSEHLHDEPPVEELLDIDTEYRRRVAEGSLRKIAPRRFNPTGEAWLPILHTTREDRHYHAMFSNTARAHELGTTRDWVIISRDDDGHHGQWTVITSTLGKLKGHRIVRGREAECETVILEPRSAEFSDSTRKQSDLASQNFRTTSRRQLTLFPVVPGNSGI